MTVFPKKALSLNAIEKARADKRISKAPLYEGWPSLRAVFISLFMSVLTGLAVRQITLIYHAGEPESSVPPVPAIAWLLVLVALNHIWQRWRQRQLFSPAELLTIYMIVVLTTAMSARFMMRMLLAYLTTPFYQEDLAPVAQHLPGWLAPHNAEAVREFFEGAYTGHIPWQVWLAPMGVWTILCLLILGGMFCLVDLFRSRWAEQEHLNFPLIYLPVELCTTQASGRPPFLSDRLMWGGFAMAVLYALPVILAPLWPNFPDWRKTFYPFQAITNRPWNEMSSIYIRMHPHLVGFGYLMSGENLFTIWAGYFLQKLFWIVLTSFGYSRPAWHKGHEVEQLMGAMMIVALWLFWRSRRSLAHTLNTPGHPDRWRVWGALGGFLGTIWILAQAGIPVWLGASFLGMLFAEALVYARIRAETGLPSYWATTGRFEQRDLLFDLFGPRTIKSWTGFPALANFSLLGWTTMGQFQAMAAYQAEAGQLSRKSGIAPAPLMGMSLGAIFVGLMIAWWIHLKTFYEIGALMATGSGGTGYWELSAARGMHKKFLAAKDANYNFRFAPTLFRLGGAGVVWLLAWLRGRYTGFPLTPWGYMITCSYGATFWPSFLLVWIIQRLILRYGGPRAYKRFIPFFLGIAFGHMSAAIIALLMALISGSGPSFAGGRRIYFDI